MDRAVSFLMQDEIGRTGALVAALSVASVMGSTGCYASHRLPIEVDDLRETEGTPRLDACRPRFPESVVVYDGPTFDSGMLDVTWTGSTFLLAFQPLDGVQWGARVTPGGDVVPLEEALSLSHLRPVPGTSLVAAGGVDGLWLLDPEGNVVGGPSLVGPPEGAWQWVMEPVARPTGLAVVGSVWGHTVTSESAPGGVYGWSTALPWSLPDRMPTEPIVPTGSSWLLAQAVGPDAFGAFVVVQDGVDLSVIDFADDGEAHVAASWSTDPGRTLHGAVSLPAGEFAILFDWLSDDARSLSWFDVESGTSSPLAPLGRRLGSWTAVESFGEQALIAAPFAGPTLGEDAPLTFRTYEATSSRHDAELVIDTETRVREVALARHPCGFSAAWRVEETTVHFQAFDCCEGSP